MTARTQLTPIGGSRRYGTFAGYVPSVHPFIKGTQLTTVGGSRRYGSFAGRVAPGSHPFINGVQLTVVGGGQRYGSFTNRDAVLPPGENGHPVGRITQLTSIGGSRRYGIFGSLITPVLFELEAPISMGSRGIPQTTQTSLTTRIPNEGTLSGTDGADVCAFTGTVSASYLTLNPIEDIVQGEWKTLSNTSLYPVLGKKTTVDLDYVFADSDTNVDPMLLQFEAGTAPSTTSGHTITTVVKTVTKVTRFTMTLYQDQTSLDSWSQIVSPGTVNTITHIVPENIVSTITDYSKLRVQISAEVVS